MHNTAAVFDTRCYTSSLIIFGPELVLLRVAAAASDDFCIQSEALSRISDIVVFFEAGSVVPLPIGCGTATAAAM